MKKILYVSAFSPKKHAGHAGGRVAFENLTRLQSEGDVDAVVCTSENIPAGSEQSIKVISQSKISFSLYIVKNFGALSWRTLLAAPIIHSRLNLEAEGVIADLLRIHHYDEVFVDFTQCLLLVSRAMARSGTKMRITACLHDVFAQRMIRSRGLVESALTGLICRQEQELIGSLDGITVLCEKDRDLVKSLYAATSVVIKPFSAPDWCASVDRCSNRSDPENVVFFGNFERSENSSAARWFIANAMPKMRSAIPGLVLTLVGTGSERLAAKIGVVDVVGTGFVEDPSSYFSRCGCAIAPLFEGAGVKFKVLEALACGVPVIGTAVACEGIVPQPMLFHAEHAAFAAETIRILKMAHHGNTDLPVVRP